jgi:hypothetical protein
MQIYENVRFFKCRLRYFFIITCLLISSTQTAFSQDKKISIRANSNTIEQVFKKIEEQTGYSFAYNRTKFDYNRRVTLQMDNASYKDVLSLLLKNTGYTYRVSGKNLYILPSKQEPVLLASKDVPALAEVDTIIAEPAREFKKLDLGEEKQPVIVSVDAPKRIENGIQLMASFESQPPVYKSPNFGLKTNLLFDATLNPSMGAEIRLNNKMTFDLAFSINPWNQNGNKKFNHLLVQPELRYWLCDPFGGHFFGIHGAYANFNISGVGFSDFMKDHRFEGNLYGGGISYGYQWVLSPHWSLEATIGVGYLYIDYDRYECKDCGKKLESTNKNYFGPTKAGISLIYMIK